MGARGFTVDARVQRRVQRYGWDLAATDYEALWQAQLADAQAALLAAAGLRRGERVLDVACGTGLVSFAAAHAVGPGGEVLGVDLSEGMVDAARLRGAQREVLNATFMHMDAEALARLRPAAPRRPCAPGRTRCGRFR